MQRLTLAALLLLLFACRNNTSGKTIIPNDTSVVAGDSLTDLAPVIVAHEAQDTTSLNGQWYLQAVLPSDTVTGHIPFIVFEVRKHRFTGHTGCNRMNGKFTLTDSTFSFEKEIMTTKMSCVGYNERAFLENLLRANHFKITDGVLILMADRTELSRWTRKPEKPDNIDKA